MQNEYWKSVVGFEGFYEVSNYGKVRSIERYVKQSGHLRFVPQKMKQETVNRSGYPVVTLCKDRKSRQYLIHRLVAEAFIPNPDNKPFVDHINTNIKDYRVENLRWVTAKENANNKLTLVHCRENTYTKERTDKILETKRGKSYKGAPKRVFQFTKDGVFIKEYSSVAEAIREIGKNIGIYRALNDPTMSAGGYLWFSDKQVNPIYKRRKEKHQLAICYCDAEGNLIKEFDSINEASRKTGIPRRNISRSLRSKWKPRKYKFKLKGDL